MQFLHSEVNEIIRNNYFLKNVKTTLYFTRSSVSVNRMNMEKLIKKAQQGDREAMRSIMITYRQLIEAAVRKSVWNRECADDAIQNVCLKVIRSIGSFKGSCRFSTWLYRVAVNECMQMNRLSMRGRRITGEECGMDIFPDPDAPDGFRNVDRKEIMTALSHCIKVLPDGMRSAYSLFYVEQFTGCEAAEKLGITLQAFFVRLSAARSRLRQELVKKGFVA